MSGMVSPAIGTVSTTLAANQSVNVTQIGGVALALGQALMASSIPVAIASNQSALAVTGTFWQATQPISGTVTANAGTNLNTSALALETGGNLATLAGAVSASKVNINISSISAPVTSPLGVVGTIASGSTDSGNPVKIGGIYNSTQPTVLTGQRVDLQATARGALIVGTGVDTFNATINTALPAGTNVIGHVIMDTSSTTAVTQATASNLNATVVGTGTFAVQATEATLDAAIVAQGTALGTIKHLMTAGSVTTNAPTYTTGNINPLSLTTAGGLRVDLKDTAANTNNLNVNLAASAATVTVSATNLSTNVAQINGVTPLMGNGVTGTGSLRVTVASDNTAFAVNATLSAETTKVIGTVNQGTSPWVSNVSQINGVTPLMGNGVTGTGSLRVTVASDNTVIPGVGAGATGSAVPANAVYKGVNAQTALPTAATAGNLTGATADKFGRQVVLPVAFRDLVGTQTTTISASTTETTIVTAALNIFHDLLLLVCSNTSATAVRIDFRDTTAGSILFSLYVPAGDTRGFSLGGVPIPQTSANTNWTAQSSASVTDLRIYAVYVSNK